MNIPLIIKKRKNRVHITTPDQQVALEMHASCQPEAHLAQRTRFDHQNWLTTILLRTATSCILIEDITKHGTNYEEYPAQQCQTIFGKHWKTSKLETLLENYRRNIVHGTI